MPRSSSSRPLSIGGAISTVSSPLRNSFVDVSCRSPINPRRPGRPTHKNEVASGPNGLFLNTAESRYATFNSSTYLSTPRSFPIASPRKSHSSIYSPKYNDDDQLSSSTTLVSPYSTNTLPLTPNYNPPSSSGKLGTFSAINIILGKTIGVGIYSIPSSIFNSVGSVGASITLWILGSAISFCGLAVYLDLGTAIPRSGGERIYLERIFRKPHMLATCMFMSYVVLLGFSTPNCIVLGEYVMYALQIEVNRWNVRSVAVAVITLICFIHARYKKLGLRIINILGVGKMAILVIVILSGVAGIIMGVGSEYSPLALTARRLRPDSYSSLSEGDGHLTTAQRNFSNLFEGSSTQPHDYATALLKILYCFRGYSTANQVLSSVRNPIPTLKRAAPIALLLVSAAYILANIAYFAVVSREDFRSSGVLIAGYFFRNIFGEQVGGNILPLFIIISAFGNIAATSFAQACVNMELGRDGLLPFSRFFKHSISLSSILGKTGSSSNEKDQLQEEDATPGLILHWLVSILVIILPPPGEIYNFLVDIGGYPVSVISVSISVGLLYLQLNPSENWKGHEGYESKKIYTAVFAASNVLLLVLPWIKPNGGVEGREGLGGGERFKWYAYPSTGLGILGLGVLYWVWWSKIKPRVCGGLAGGRSWLRGHQKRDSGGEDVPMMNFEFNGGEDGDEDRLAESILDEDLDEASGIRKRAPCGCPIPHSANPKESGSS
ncbi:putative high-affinity methionine permease protein [Venustampulla echinocandica]|uniref:Putative high-affinity methionine permease protein n=1 Tax=Venustampulla echinocandica TaxID=2656787 RepID=A0A370TZY0_9HELO|nr:putative high-affinity methionine permease protein [Venustampulla echinocandica]RDL41067.1 putative high-affinity methionine permease protein [Venustampulla echinocandica]